MFVQRPPFAWTTVPSERPEAGVPVPGWLERRAHPAMTAMSATASPDPSSTHRRVDADPAGRPPAVPGRAGRAGLPRRGRGRPAAVALVGHRDGLLRQDR